MSRKALGDEACDGFGASQVLPPGGEDRLRKKGLVPRPVYRLPRLIYTDAT